VTTVNVQMMGVPMNGEQRWVLAFDASCGTCRQLAATVRRECGDDVDVRPLDDEEVGRWRNAALGADPPSAPTLMSISGDRTRAWTGPRMAIRLVRHLGPRTTVRLLRAFGDLKSRCSEASGTGAGIRRKDFLRIAAGTVTAGAFVVLGKTPAIAGPAEHAARAQAWVKANIDRIPRSYDGLAPFDRTYRRAIYGALPGSDRAGLWSEHLARRSSELPALSAEQSEVIKRAYALASDASTFAATSSAKHEQLEELRISAIAAFGVERARTLLATLGPDAAADDDCCLCDCCTYSDYCSSRCIYDGTDRCDHTPAWCGTFWNYECNGCCFYCGQRGCC
jgi:hypothetical protein